MGLDQRIWAEIEVGGMQKRVAIHYWRKDYQMDQWFFSRLPKADQEAIESENHAAWGCDLTAVDLDLLEVNGYLSLWEESFLVSSDVRNFTVDDSP